MLLLFMSIKIQKGYGEDSPEKKFKHLKNGWGTKATIKR